MEELLDDFEDANCKHLDNDLEDWIDDKVDFERNEIVKVSKNNSKYHNIFFSVVCLGNRVS